MKKCIVAAVLILLFSVLLSGRLMHEKAKVDNVTPTIDSVPKTDRFVDFEATIVKYFESSDKLIESVMELNSVVLAIEKKGEEIRSLTPDPSTSEEGNDCPLTPSESGDTLNFEIEVIKKVK